MTTEPTQDPWQKARTSLRRRDVVLRPIIRQVGPCTLRPVTDLYATLVRSIVAQQISTKAAASITNKLIHGACGGQLAPARLLNCSEETLRAAGLSTAKRRSLMDLSDRVVNRGLDLDGLRELADEEVIARLLPVRGIGRWTAQMFLIFSLGRPDVLPVDDLGLKVAIQRHYGMDSLPARLTIEETAKKWRPWSSVATWYLWRSLDSGK
jgi:DNA-3-methyladenine glycosylase II